MERAIMRFKGLDLNLLVALDVLFQELNVTRAAVRMNTTQSTMSGILARLRAHFGDELLVSYGRSLRQTPLAEQLQGPLREAIVRLEAIVEADGSFDPASSNRHFKVEFPDHLIPVLLPLITARLAMSAPMLTIEFSLPRGDPAPLLHRGELDLVVTPHTYRTEEYRSLPLLEDRMVVVGCKDNPALAAQPDMMKLDELPIITVRFDPNRVSASLTESQLKLIEGRGHVTLIAPTFSSIPALLVGSRFFTFLHRNLAQAYASRLPLVIHELPFESPALRDVIMFHPNRENDAGLMWLAEQFIGIANTLDSSHT
jgi:DNA-binding transcriptional LysR family regulator